MKDSKTLMSLVSAKMETETKEKYRNSLKGDNYNHMFDHRPSYLVNRIVPVIFLGIITYYINQTLFYFVLAISILSLSFEQYNFRVKRKKQISLMKDLNMNNSEICFSCGKLSPKGENCAYCGNVLS